MACLLEGLHGDQPGHHSSGAVEIPACRHRIKMRTNHHRRQGPVAASPLHVEIAGVVLAHFQSERARMARHQLVRELLARSVRGPCHAAGIAVPAAVAQRIEQRLRDTFQSNHRSLQLRFRTH
jgi:hypothetical protein